MICTECGHPANHHDAGECWTDANGEQTWDETSCSCCWFTPTTPNDGSDATDG